MRGLLLFPQFPVGSCVCPAVAAAAEADRQFRPRPPPHTLEEGGDVGQTATINRGKDMTHVTPWRLHSDDDTQREEERKKEKEKRGVLAASPPAAASNLWGGGEKRWDSQQQKIARRFCCRIAKGRREENSSLIPHVHRHSLHLLFSLRTQSLGDEDREERQKAKRSNGRTS